MAEQMTWGALLTKYPGEEAQLWLLDARDQGATPEDAERVLAGNVVTARRKGVGDDILDGALGPGKAQELARLSQNLAFEAEHGISIAEHRKAMGELSNTEIVKEQITGTPRAVWDSIVRNATGFAAGAEATAQIPRALPQAGPLNPTAEALARAVLPGTRELEPGEFERAYKGPAGPAAMFQRGVPVGPGSAAAVESVAASALGRFGLPGKVAGIAADQAITGPVDVSGAVSKASQPLSRFVETLPGGQGLGLRPTDLGQARAGQPRIPNPAMQALPLDMRPRVIEQQGPAAWDVPGTARPGVVPAQPYSGATSVLPAPLRADQRVPRESAEWLAANPQQMPPPLGRGTELTVPGSPVVQPPLAPAPFLKPAGSDELARALVRVKDEASAIKFWEQYGAHIEQMSEGERRLIDQELSRRLSASVGESVGGAAAVRRGPNFGNTYQGQTTVSGELAPDAPFPTRAVGDYPGGAPADVAAGLRTANPELDVPASSALSTRIATRAEGPLPNRTMTVSQAEQKFRPSVGSGNTSYSNANDIAQGVEQLRDTPDGRVAFVGRVAENGPENYGTLSANLQNDGSVAIRSNTPTNALDQGTPLSREAQDAALRAEGNELARYSSVQEAVAAIRSGDLQRTLDRFAARTPGESMPTGRVEGSFGGAITQTPRRQGTDQRILPHAAEARHQVAQERLTRVQNMADVSHSEQVTGRYYEYDAETGQPVIRGEGSETAVPGAAADRIRALTDPLTQKAAARGVQSELEQGGAVLSRDPNQRRIEEPGLDEIVDKLTSRYGSAGGIDPADIGKAVKSVTNKMQELMQRLGLSHKEEVSKLMNSYYGKRAMMFVHAREMARTYADLFGREEGLKLTEDLVKAGQKALRSEFIEAAMAADSSLTKRAADELISDVFEAETAINGVLRGMVGALKTTKVLYSFPTAYINNILGNVPFMLLGGGGAKEFASGAAARALAEGGKEYKEALAHGLFGSEFFAQDTKAFIKSLRDELHVGKGGMGEALGRNFRNFNRRLAAGYDGIDKLFKMAAYQAARRRGLSPEAAVQHVYKFFPNYEKLARPFQAIRKNSIGALFMNPFVAFPLESMRIFKNVVKENPAKAGAALVGLYGMYNYGVTLGEFTGVGPTREEIVKARKESASYRNFGGRFTVPVSRSESGGVNMLDLTNWIPLLDLVSGMQQSEGDTAFERTGGLVANIAKQTFLRGFLTSDYYTAPGQPGIAQALTEAPGKLAQGEVRQAFGDIARTRVGQIATPPLLQRFLNMGRAKSYEEEGNIGRDLAEMSSVRVHDTGSESEQRRRIAEIEGQTKALLIERAKVAADVNLNKNEALREARLATIERRLEQVQAAAP